MLKFRHFLNRDEYAVKVLMEIPDDLLHDMKDIEKIYGISTNDLTISAIKRYVDKRRRLISEALKY